jgi:hypothetical protein
MDQVSDPVVLKRIDENRQALQKKRETWKKQKTGKELFL